MPFDVSSVDQYNKGLSRSAKRKWVAVANSSLKACLNKGGSDETCAPGAIKTANGVIKKDKEKEALKNKEAAMQEAVMKKMGSKNYPASSFLVVEDPETPSTWHLPVKTPEGTPDRKLAGAAWAALFSAGGHRGQKYAGANKAAAQKKLKALYKANEWPEPNSEAASEAITEYDEDMKEWYGEPMSDIPYVPSSVTSFEQLDILRQTAEMSDEIRELTGMFTQMVQNIVYWFDGDKVAQLSAVADEFIARLDQRINGGEGELPETAASPTIENDDSAGSFSESEMGGMALDIVEIDTGILAEQTSTEPEEVLRMKVAIIQPGWGNTRDNNYYSESMLRLNASKFVGAKMYETDHRDEEKSTRTWVSSVKEIVGFDNGAPIGLVSIYDANFEKKIRKLNADGQIHQMECSVYGDGRFQTGFELGGRKGKNVLEITDIKSVDWVTRAGAGGRVLSLAESINGGITMTDEVKPKDEEVQPTETSNVPVTVHETEAVTSGSETVTEIPVTTEAIPATTTTEAEPVQERTPTVLPASDVRSLLEASHLPKAAIERLAKETYEEEAAVTLAIKTEKSYLAEVLGAGKVTGMGAPDAKSATKLAESEKARAEAAERVNKKFLGGYK